MKNLLTQAQAVDAVTDGVRRARCLLVGYEFQGKNLQVSVKKAESDIHHVALEYDWQTMDEGDIKERIRRFAEHYCLKHPFKWHWGDSLV